AVEVARGAARNAAHGEVVPDRRKRGDGGIVEARVHITAFADFQQVPEQAEAGNVGDGAHARHGRDLGTDAVELAHHVPGKGGMFGGEVLLLLCSGEYADAERLGEIEPAASARGVVLLEVFARNLPGNGEAQDGLRRVDAVAARQG